MATNVVVTVEKGCWKDFADLRNEWESHAVIKEDFIERVKYHEEFQRLQSDKYDQLLRDAGFQRTIGVATYDVIEIPCVL